MASIPRSTGSLIPAIFPATAIAAGCFLVISASFLVLSTRPPTTSLKLDRLSPLRLDYENAASGVPQIVELVLKNSNGFRITNVQVIPSCGCVANDFDVIELLPGESHAGKLTLRNEKDDARTSTILIQYQIDGANIDELVEVSPRKTKS